MSKLCTHLKRILDRREFFKRSGATAVSALAAPYHRDRTHYTFRFVWDHCGGQTTNLGVHVLDIVQWALGTDRTGPVEVEDMGGVFPQDGLFSTPT